MDADAVRARRLRAHALSYPVEDVTAAARRLTATQAQEFWGGRWALAVRASGDSPLADVDAAFDRGEIVRSWTQRGTLHIVPAEEWLLDEAGAPGDARGDERNAAPAAASDVFALPPFEEYYLSYADRTFACPPERKGAVGPGANGAVKPIVVSGGEVVGTWKHSQAADRRHLAPEAELFAESRVAAASVDAALERFARFIGG